VRFVLDASALLALLRAEPGSERVEQALVGGAGMVSVNYAEVVGKLCDAGYAEAEARASLIGLQLEIAPLDEGLALDAGWLRSIAGCRGLSLGDRACLALGRRLGLPVLTTDRAWRGAVPGVEVVVLR
jgi:ribonuclease VapC